MIFPKNNQQIALFSGNYEANFCTSGIKNEHWKTLSLLSETHSLF